MSAPFDPDDAAHPGSGIFGLPPDPERARVHVIPVPFDATTSYRRGAARGPGAIALASMQVELTDLEFGRPFEAGIHLREADPRIADLEAEACRCDDRGRVDAIGAEINTIVRAEAEDVLRADRLPVVLGGDHSVSFGAIEACAERFPGMGILHVDAHADLREAFEGYTWSHASILFNVVTRLADRIGPLVQIGLRDLGAREVARIEESPNIHALFDRAWQDARFAGHDLGALARETIDELPENVYVTFDVDGLCPTLCPNTGTPVPGGFTWPEAMLWLRALADSGRRVAGLDLVEVAPGNERPEGDGIDEIVGARLLYRLIGVATGADGDPPGRDGLKRASPFPQ